MNLFKGKWNVEHNKRGEQIYAGDNEGLKKILLGWFQQVFWKCAHK
jgi:hypothetical protein